MYCVYVYFMGGMFWYVTPKKKKQKTVYRVSVPKSNVIASYETIILLLGWTLFQSKYFSKVWDILINFVELFGCMYKAFALLRHTVVNYQITAIKWSSLDTF